MQENNAGLTDVIRLMYAYNTWANERIMTQVAELTPEQYVAPGSASFSSVRDTLVHTLWAQALWLSRWQGGPNFPWYDPNELSRPRNAPYALAGMRSGDARLRRGLGRCRVEPDDPLPQQPRRADGVPTLADHAASSESWHPAPERSRCPSYGVRSLSRLDGFTDLSRFAQGAMTDSD